MRGAIPVVAAVVSQKALSLITCAATTCSLIGGPLPSSPLVVTAAALAAPDAMHAALTCVEKSGSITLLVGSLNMSPALAQPED